MAFKFISGQYGKENHATSKGKLFYAWESRTQNVIGTDRMPVSLYCLPRDLTVYRCVCKSGTEKTCLSFMLIWELLA